MGGGGGEAGEGDSKVASLLFIFYTRFLLSAGRKDCSEGAWYEEGVFFTFLFIIFLLLLFLFTFSFRLSLSSVYAFPYIFRFSLLSLISYY